MLQIVTRLLLFANLCTICLTLELTLRFAPSIHKIRSHLEANCKFHSLHCNVHCDFVSTFTFREWSMFLIYFHICQITGKYHIHWMSGQGYYLYQLFGDACKQALGISWRFHKSDIISCLLPCTAVLVGHVKDKENITWNISKMIFLKTLPSTLDAN